MVGLFSECTEIILHRTILPRMDVLLSLVRRGIVYLLAMITASLLHNES